MNKWVMFKFFLAWYCCHEIRGRGQPMNKLVVAVTTAFCLAGVTTSANAFCVTGDASQGCPRPFSSGNSSTQPDDEATQQGFDTQNGNQWSRSSHKFGDFTFYSGFSSGNSWDSRQRVFGNGLNEPGFSSQDQAGSSHCAFYGDC